MQLPAPGDLFNGRYRIDKLLGKGGFGCVFGAEDSVNGRRVALKVLVPDRGDGAGYQRSTTARFQREIRAAASLRSPHTVVMHDCGESADGHLFMVFEYLDGEDLSALLDRRGKLSQDETVSVLRQLLESLDEAHRLGLLHRDIKPENVRVSIAPGGQLAVKLLDFGLVRPTDAGSPSITATGEVIGTPRYMSPEQLRGQPLTAQSDIYSLGMLAYEMVMGPRALQGNRWTDQVSRLVDENPFRLPAESGVESWFADLVSQMTAVTEGSRPMSAHAVLRALGRSADEREPVGEARPERPLALVLGGVCVALVAVIALMLSGKDKPPAPVPATRPLASINTPPPADPVESEPAPESPTLVAGSGCGLAPKFVGEGSLGTFTTRWLTYVPQRYENTHAYPVLVVLHEGAQSPKHLVDASGFRELADDEGFIIVAPRDPEEALLQTWTRPSRTLDVVSTAVETTAEQFCVDRERVFVVGQGEGGGAAIHLACEPWVRAIASNSYLFFEGKTKVCDAPKATIPYLLIAAKKSGVNPFEGGEGCLPGRAKISAHQMQAIFVERNQCSGEVVRVIDEVGGACRTWTCGTPFQSCWTRGGQGWPGTRRDSLANACDGEPPDFPTARVVWDFFKAQGPEHAE